MYKLEVNEVRALMRVPISCSKEATMFKALFIITAVFVFCQVFLRGLTEVIKERAKGNSREVRQ